MSAQDDPPPSTAPPQVTADTPSMSFPTDLPSTRELSDSFKASLRTAVRSTNEALASAEESFGSVRAPVVQKWQDVKSVTADAAQMMTVASDTWERRRQYGMAGVAATSVTMGALVAMRRGKGPGVVAAFLAGGTAYGMVYGLEDLDLQQYKRW